MKSTSLLENINKIHFIGIGGSGMSPLAQIFKSRGYTVTGSDVYESDALKRIKNLGISVCMCHKQENINAELVVYSAAIKSDNPELTAAAERNIPTIERSHLLGLVTKSYQNCIAVSGTHGKTTTTAMLTQILLNSNLDPTAIIGGHFPLINGNACIGKSQTIICEACEYVDTFLQLTPAVSIILNVDADHLDYFQNLKNIQKSFNKFASQTTKLIVINGDDENAKVAVKNINTPIIKFGFDRPNDYYIKEAVDKDMPKMQFTLMFKEKQIAKIRMNVPGIHNIYNALAAGAAAHSVGADLNAIADGLSQFSGVRRRFEILGKQNGVTIADDFAHHPTELRATISTAMNMGFKKVWAVFEPHTYSRTYMLLKDFAEALSLADRVVLSEILAVREENIYNIFAKDLAENIDGCVWFKTFEQIADYIAANAEPGDLVITLGGGHIYKCARLILDRLKVRLPH
ncbi:MAG: UDP-N-acetylmuramate--L-alanine ligase [Oscillospiraceae bacterium]|nr:UDP-N-acetylmuramate--L-alanine ligase [Oscillospiraceae bacterium]